MQGGPAQAEEEVSRPEEELSADSGCSAAAAAWPLTRTNPNTHFAVMSKAAYAIVS